MPKITQRRPRGGGAVGAAQRDDGIGGKTTRSSTTRTLKTRSSVRFQLPPDEVSMVNDGNKSVVGSKGVGAKLDDNGELIWSILSIDD